MKNIIKLKYEYHVKNNTYKNEMINPYKIQRRFKQEYTEEIVMIAKYAEKRMFNLREIEVP